MKELVVVSGKGGTGKTSVVASFAALAGNKVLADCDVDAADLHLVIAPAIQRREEFVGGKRARVIEGECTACGACGEACRFEAVQGGAGHDGYRVDPLRCEGCGVCVRVCPAGAIAFELAVNGEWYVSDTRHGPMVHGRLGIAQENSGKMVTVIRNRAKELAQERGLGLILVDGSPGVGCPVIASLAGATLALAVTEPTLSGLHDLERVAELTRRLGVRTAVCVNKWDVNPELAEGIEDRSRDLGLGLVGRVRYDPSVTAAQIRGLSAVELGDSVAARDHRAVWEAAACVLGRGG